MFYEVVYGLMEMFVNMNWGNEVILVGGSKNNLWADNIM